jgi:hypothetical protein
MAISKERYNTIPIELRNMFKRDEITVLQWVGPTKVRIKLINNSWYFYKLVAGHWKYQYSERRRGR